MTKDSTPSISCLGCGSASFATDRDRIPVCEYCRVAYAPHGRKCSTCSASCEPADRRCSFCGAPLVHECPVCGTLNPLEARECLVCQQTLDATDEMFARLTRSTTGQLRKTRELGAKIKTREEAASEARLAKMWAEEEERQADLARARAERRRQERLMVTAAVGVVAIVVVVAIVTAIILTNNAPTPLF